MKKLIIVDLKLTFNQSAFDLCIISSLCGYLLKGVHTRPFVLTEYPESFSFALEEINADGYLRATINEL